MRLVPFTLRTNFFCIEDLIDSLKISEIDKNEGTPLPRDRQVSIDRGYASFLSGYSYHTALTLRFAYG